MRDQHEQAEEHAAIPANVVHEAILKQGHEELSRSRTALFW